ncbi:MAG: hypothetical protein ACOC8K_05705 [Gemmatimonadota bacterium]
MPGPAPAVGGLARLAGFGYTTGLHLGGVHRLAGSPWSLGGILTVNYAGSSP